MHTLETSSFRTAIHVLQQASMTWRERVPTSLPLGGSGWATTMACLFEATAPKPGNVHCNAAFPDLSYEDLTAAAMAIGPVFENDKKKRLGEVILDAVQETRLVTDSNANLGIILSIAPLSVINRSIWLRAMEPDFVLLLSSEVSSFLTNLGPQDSREIWSAIALAQPGGLGSVQQHDLSGPPPQNIVSAMLAAAERDHIAKMWSIGYSDVLADVISDLTHNLSKSDNWRVGIVDAFMRQLARSPDSHIARRHGEKVALNVSAQAAAILKTNGIENSHVLQGFDRSLRVPVRINPGTTADLIATALYIILRSPLNA